MSADSSTVEKAEAELESAVEVYSFEIDGASFSPTDHRKIMEDLDRRVVKELDSLAADVRQRFLRISELIEKHGRAAMHEPHVKHLEGKLWEMRMKGRDGIARAVFVTRRVNG